MRLIVLLLATLFCLAGPALHAVDVPKLSSVDEDQPGDWITEFKFGVFFTNVNSQNAVASRDPSISGSHESTSWLLTLDGKANYIVDEDDRIDQMLVLRYGRAKVDRGDWIENSDLVDYDGSYKHLFKKPHFVYVAWGLDTVFTGPEPEKDPFDPILAKISTGYGQLYKNMRPITDQFEWRVGVRAQRRFGRQLTHREEEWEIGPEFFTRYERKQTEQLSYFAQYEAFSEFNDMGHLSNLGTAGLDLLLMPYLTVRLAVRAYYECEPEDAETGIGYDEFSYRQETLVGLTWTL
jgi:hypothetical protein